MSRASIDRPAATLSLLEVVKSVIERTYRMDTGIQGVERFVVGDLGLRRWYADASILQSVGSAVSEARVLVREVHGVVYASIYYPDLLIAQLEAFNPLRGLHTRNIDAFAVFVEELDHFLTIADRTRQARPVSLFELELHANVTKYMMCRHLLSRSLGRPLVVEERAWVRYRLFEMLEPPPSPPELRNRYRDADRFAALYVVMLERLPPRELLTELRAFHQLPGDVAVRRIRSLAVH